MAFLKKKELIGEKNRKGFKEEKSGMADSNRRPQRPERDTISDNLN